MNPLGTFFSDNLSVVYFVYGLAFFTLGLTIALAPKPQLPAFAAHFRWLAAFGLVHSLVEWSDMFALSGRTIPSTLRLFLLIVSLFLLLQFGVQILLTWHPTRQWLRWSPYALLGLWAVSVSVADTFTPPSVEFTNAEVFARYALYFPGCVLAGWAFLSTRRQLATKQPPRLRRDLNATAFVFFLNSFFAGLIVPPAPYPPAAWLNAATLVATVGIPAPLFRALAAIGIAYWVVSILRTFEIERAQALQTAQVAARESAERRSRELAEELARSELHYEYIFENTNDAILIHDLPGRFLQVNRVACQRLGYTRDELLSMGVKQLDVPEIAAHYDEAVQEFLKRGSMVGETRHVRKDGTPIPVEISARLIEYKGQPAVLTVARDISERKRAEAEIQERNRELDALYREAEERARRIAVSNEIIRGVSAARSLGEVFHTFAEQTRKLVVYDRMAITLFDPTMTKLTLGVITPAEEGGPEPGMTVPLEGTIAAYVKETRQPLICPDLRQEPRFPVAHALSQKAGILSYVVLPLIWKDRLLGTLNLGSQSTNAYHDADLPILTPLAGQLAIAIENLHLQEQMQSMAIHAERERLGRELHDGLGQVLGFIGMKTATIHGMLSEGQVETARQGLAELNEIARTAYADVREAILGLRATVTAGVGVEPVLREYLHRFQREWGIASELEMVPGGLNLAPSAEIQLLRIIQEALTNVRKHARAQHVRVCMERSDAGAVVTIEDDGCGFDPNLPQRERFGLQTMRERAESVGGSAQIESAPGAGTRVRVILPKA